MKYKCSSCGQEHDEWPTLSFSSPTAYDELTQEEKNKLAELSDDVCVITYPDQIDRFIRCTLTQMLTDHCDNLDYGIWVSLSENSFQDYCNNYKNDNHLTEYFGWLCSSIPEYDNTLSIPTTVKTRTGHCRPEVIPHESFDHPFVKDYYRGITKAEAERRIISILKSTGQVTDNEK